MFRNKKNQSIVWDGKGKDRGTLIKSLINLRVEEALEGELLKIEKKLV